MLVLSRMSHTDTPAYTPCEWSTGTDAEIIEALEQHYAGHVDLTEYWSVGDVRYISTETTETMTGLDDYAWGYGRVPFVLLNAGGKELTHPINGHRECAFVVGQGCFVTINNYTGFGKMNDTDTNSGGWDSSLRRTWCNEIYPTTFSETIRPIFKEFKNITANGGQSSETTVSDDYFALMAEKEFLGEQEYPNANPVAESNLSQFEHYKTASNRIITDQYGNTPSGSSYNIWLRSPYYNNLTDFVDCAIVNSHVQATWRNGILPFGVI